MFSDNKILLIGITIISIFVIISFLKSFKNNTRNNIAFGLLLGGMAGNLADRLLLGYVRDFFDFYIFGYDFPIVLYY